MELVAAGCGDSVIRLNGRWRSLLHRLEDLGPVTARTRNDAAVHETTGRYTDVTFTDTHDMGLVLADVVDLRLFMNEWAHGFAVDETDTAPPSLQFFAPEGLVTSLELMDADGGVIARLFGKRKPGEPERTDWRILLENLPSQG